MEDAINQPNNEINNKKCYACGKVFRTPANFAAHKNRKTPCLIREVAPEHLNNPNRCIFCNKIFAQHQTLTRHLKTCKIKNGGMDVLVDKVKYEQEIRILKEQQLEDRKRIQKLEETIMQVVQKKDHVAQVINNNIINNGTINIIVNNYLKPNITHLLDKIDIKNSAFLTIYNEHRVQTPLALIPLIWFNPDKPENFSIYIKNKSNGEVLTYDGSSWKVGTFREGVGKAIRDRAYEITEGMCNIKNFQEITDPYVVDNMKRNRNDEEVMKIECEKIFHTLLQNREMVKPNTPLQ